MMPGLESILNIKEAKTEIIHTVQAYLDKDETGAYTIPPEKQRPILLMGPPGIGKTAIMEQVAEESHPPERHRPALHLAKNLR